MHRDEQHIIVLAMHYGAAVNYRGGSGVIVQQFNSYSYPSCSIVNSESP